jgi:HprK-related kinase A
MDNDCIHFSIGSINLSVRSELRELLPELAALYPENTETGDRRTIRVEVKETRGRWGRRRYRVFREGAEVGSGLRADGVFPYVEWAINLSVIGTRNEYVQLHAASMVHNGIGFIFAGASGCGKSTLAAGLMAHGWNYLCDEFALINPRLLLLHAFPKALCIKAGSFPSVRRLGLPFARRRDYVKARKGRVGYLRPLEKDSETATAPAPIRYVIFPEYCEGGAPRLDPMPRGEALMELAGCLFNRHVYDDQALPILSEMVAKAQCFRLQTGPLEETCAYLESQLGGDRSREVMAEVTTRNSTLPGVRVTKPGATRFSPSRRQVLRKGAKLAYLTPAVMALSSQKAFASASDPSGICSTGQASGELCESDLDCCSSDCDFGVCN